MIHVGGNLDLGRTTEVKIHEVPGTLTTTSDPAGQGSQRQVNTFLGSILTKCRTSLECLTIGIFWHTLAISTRSLPVTSFPRLRILALHSTFFNVALLEGVMQKSPALQELKLEWCGLVLMSRPWKVLFDAMRERGKIKSVYFYRCWDANNENWFCEYGIEEATSAVAFLPIAPTEYGQDLSKYLCKQGGWTEALREVFDRL